MIGLEKQDNGLYIVSDEDYSPNRYMVLLNFLEKQGLEILDYSITAKKIFLSMDMDGINVAPLSLEDDFKEVLISLSDAFDEEELDDVKFNLKILCMNKPFDVTLITDKHEFKTDVANLLEDVRHYLVTTDSLVVCDDESMLSDERFWSLENSEMISRVDELLDKVGL